MSVCMKRLTAIIMSLFLIVNVLPFSAVLETNAYDRLIRGIDISQFQTVTSWNSVANSVDFVIIRVGTTTGLNNDNFRKDTKFESHYEGARNAGIPVGIYYYSGANTLSGFQKNANECVEYLNGKSVDYPVYLDVEQSSGQMSLGKSTLTSYILSALNIISNAGYKAGVYANQDWFNNYVDGAAIRNAGYSTWLARYPSAKYAVDPSGYDYSSNYDIWQYSSVGQVSGISGEVDVDVSYVDFRVPKPDMVKPSISFDKSTYNIGDTVNVSWTPSPPGSDCAHYWIAIWNPSGENIVNEDPYGTSYSFTVDQEGTYRVWTAATPYWSTEGEDSLTDERTFEVASPIPSGPILSEGAGQTLPDGDYFIFSNLNSKSFLDIVGTDIPAAAGTNVTMYNFGKEDYPREVHACDAWTLQYLNNGFYKIKQKSTGMCLDVQGASQQRGTNVQVWTEHDGAAQQWSIAATDNGYTIRARCGGYYLDMHNAETADGTNVQLWDLDDGKHQRWGFVPFAPSIGQTIEDGTYTIQSAVNSEYCLDVHGRDGNAYTKETNVWLWPINDCNDTFNVKYLGDGYYSICEAVSGLALDIVDKGAEGYLNVGNNIQVFTNNQTANQKWIIRDAGDGYYNIISAYSGYSLDLSGGIAENGRNIAQYYYNTSNAQKWKFISPIEAPKSAMLKSDKKSAIVGETITFTADSDTATAYWIGIDKDRERIITEEMKDGTLSISFDEAGEYTAYVTASNVMGGVDSAKIEFNVKLDIILHVNEIYELPFSDNRYTYKSHNTNIATVTKNGVITALKEGTTILSVVTEDSEVIQYTLKVVEQNIEGDCNADGEFNIADVVLLQEWLLAVPDTHLANWQAANLCEDDRLDVFDLCLMKRKLING